MFGMKAFFRILMMAFVCRMMEDDGMGDGVDVGEGDTAVSSEPSTPNVSDAVTLSREELAQLTAPMQELLQERAVNNAVADIKGRVSDFNLDAVHNHLKEIHKTDPARAEALNNPSGWELLYKAEIAPKSVSADAVNSGRNVDAEGGRQALINRVKQGDASVHERASIFEKYL